MQGRSISVDSPIVRQLASALLILFAFRAARPKKSTLHHDTPTQSNEAA
jgi:hypothetical protein